METPRVTVMARPLLGEVPPDPLTLFPSPFTLSWNLARHVPGVTWRSFSSSTIWGSCPSSDVDSAPSCSWLTENRGAV